MPVLIPLNYANGRGHDLNPDGQGSSAATRATGQVTGLDTLAFGNVSPSNTGRYTAHLVCAVAVVVWFCYVAFIELHRAAVDSAGSGKEEIARQQRLIDNFRIEILAEDVEGSKAKCTAGEKGGSARAARTHDAAASTIRESNLRAWPVEENHRTAKSRNRSRRPPEPYVDPLNPCESCEKAQESSRNIIWDNVRLSWWQGWLQLIAVVVVLGAMILLWVVPVTSTAALSQLDSLIRNDPFFQRHENLRRLCLCLAGVVPAGALALIFAILPPVLKLLSRMSGATQRSQQALYVQRFYFGFLFIQMVLVVSIASFFTSSLHQFWHNVETLRSPSNILHLLSQNLPSAANYFFSYMILQALSGSSSLILQQWPLFWCVAGKLCNRSRGRGLARSDRVDIVAWGALFPVHTTLACICLIYSVIAPLISLFAVLSFGLFWLAYQHSIVYTQEHDLDHGGVLYSQAINQTFTGVYVMELCLAGLFFGVRDEVGAQSCLRHGIVMIVSVALTASFQIVLNLSYLPRIQRDVALSKGAYNNAASALLCEHLRHNADAPRRGNVSSSSLPNGDAEGPKAENAQPTAKPEAGDVEC